MFNIDPKDLSLQDAAGMQLVKLIKRAGESGGNEELIVNCVIDSETGNGTMDHTLGEIYAAIMEHKSVAFVANQSTNTLITDTITFILSNGEDMLLTANARYVHPFSGVVTYMTFYCYGYGDNNQGRLINEIMPQYTPPRWIVAFSSNTVTTYTYYPDLDDAYAMGLSIVALDQDTGDMYMMSKKDLGTNTYYEFTNVSYDSGVTLKKLVFYHDNSIELYINGVKYEP